MTCVHYFDISLKKIPSYVQLKFNIKANIHKIITTFSTNALDNRTQDTLYDNVYFVVCQMDDRLRYGPWLYGMLVK